MVKITIITDYLFTAVANGENISYSTTLTTNNTESCLATVNLVETNDIYYNSNSNYTNSIINNQFYCEQDGYSYCTYLNISDIYCAGNDNEYGISTIKIGIYGEPLAGNEDLFTIFSYTTYINDSTGHYDKYFTLLNDWDTRVWIPASANKDAGGAFIAPECNSSSFLSTDINESIFDLLGKGNLYNNIAIREDVAGGDSDNYELLTDNELDDGPFYITLKSDRINGQTKVIFENNGINNNNSSATCLYNDVFASENIIVNMFLDQVDAVAFDKFEIEYTCEIITVLAPTSNTIPPTFTTSMPSIITTRGGSSTSVPSQQPVDLSSVQPTLQPSVEPSRHPSTSVPSQQPTVQSSDETVVVTTNASSTTDPSSVPSSEPTVEPSVVPTAMYTSSNIDLATIESTLKTTSTLNYNTTINSNISDIILLNNTAVNDTIGVNASDIYNVVIIVDTSDNDIDNEKTPFMRKYILYILIACVCVVLLCILTIAICIYYRNYNNRKQQLQGSKSKSLNSSNATNHGGRGINIISEKNVRLALEIVNYNVLNQTSGNNKGLTTSGGIRSTQTGHEGESHAARVEGAPDYDRKQQQVATEISLNNGNNIGDEQEQSISSSGENEDLYESGIETKHS